MIHEPRAFLRDTKRAVHLVTADPVLAIGDHPDSSEPLAEIDRAILENRADLGGELLPWVLFLAFPHAARCNEPRIGATARGTMDAVRPAQFDHRSQGDVGIGEIPDGFDEGAGLVWCVRHADQYDSDRSLCQVYYYPN